MNPLSLLAPYKLLIEIIVIGAIFAAISLAIHNFLNHEREIGRNEIRGEYAQKLAEAQAQAHQKELALTAQLNEAVKNGQEREQTLRAAATAAGNASLSLRDTLNSIRNGVPSATLDALRANTTTLAAVLTDCQGKYRDVAESADRHANDTKTLMEAWPK